MCAVSSLVNRKSHCWRLDHLTGCIWNLLAHILLPLATGALWVSWLKRWLLFVAQAGKMTIFVTGLALTLPGRTLETFYIHGITTFWTSISSFVYLAWIRFLKGWSLILLFIGVPLLMLLSLLVGMLFQFGLAQWEVRFLMPHEINLSCLGVTCNYFDMSSSWLWRLHFLGMLPHLTCRKLLKINIRISEGLGDKLLIFQKKNRIYLCARYLQFLVGTWQEF